jgi:hypothetical protein
LAAFVGFAPLSGTGKEEQMSKELVFVKASDVRMRLDSDWGGWVLDEWELSYPAYRGGVYPIDLRRFTDATEMLNMIMQVAGKDWATNECIAGLVHALNYLLHPQALLCNGKRKLTETQIVSLVKTGDLNKKGN